MKLKLSFDVMSQMYLDDYWPIAIGNDIYEFGVDEGGIVNALHVTIANVEKQYWPAFEEPDQPGVQHKLTIKAPPITHFILHDLKVFQGMASPMGSFDIDFEHPEYHWLPENEDEKKELNIFQYKTDKGPKDKRLASSFDVVARALLVSTKLFDYEAPLSFFRRGTSDFHNNDYRLAFYNYYFFLESLFANGKFRQKDVPKQFATNTNLLAAVKKARHETLSTRGMKKTQFFKTLSETDCPETILEKIALRRGESHHHSLKNRKAWHPDRHDDFLVEANFLHLVCMDIIYGLEGAILFSPETINEFYEAGRRVGVNKIAVIEAILSERGNNHTHNMQVPILSAFNAQSTMYSVAVNYVEGLKKEKPAASLVSFVIKVDGSVVFTDSDYWRLEAVLHSMKTV